MSQAFFLQRLLFVLLFSVSGFASSLSSPKGLEERDNKWNLKCSNAPTVVAGSFLSASAVTKPLPKVLPDSGFNQPWFRYLWCVPGTKTYLFLNNGRLEPPPITYNDVGGALEQALARVQDNLTQDGDGPVKYPYNGGTTPDYTWYLTAPSTNMRVGVAPSKGTLTWGILGAAMTGLWQYANAGYDFGDYLILYQINDGEWGTVGVGYVGFVDPNDPEEKCVYQDVQGNVGYCNDVTGWKVIR